MTSNPPAASHGDRVPGTCKRPGCGNVTPVQDRGRTRVFCSDDCARRYHNDARLPAAAAQLPADSSADPLTALDTLIRQAAALTRTAREQAAGLDPARVRAQIADAEATRARQAEADARAETASVLLRTINVNLRVRASSQARHLRERSRAVGAGVNKRQRGGGRRTVQHQMSAFCRARPRVRATATCRSGHFGQCRGARLWSFSLLSCGDVP